MFVFISGQKCVQLVALCCTIAEINPISDNAMVWS